jgi:hypothetical protein
MGGPKERHSLFRFGAFVATRVRRPSMSWKSPPTLDGDKLSRWPYTISMALCSKAGAPAFVAEGRIGDDVVECPKIVVIGEQWIGDGVALPDLRRGVVVQDHVHAGEASGRVVFLLPV